jgi:hypothetical protein
MTTNASEVREEYLDPLFWNPECPNFELIDWERWESKNPGPPEVFNPPQRKSYDGGLFCPMWWTNRSCYVEPITTCLFCCCTVKTESDRITNGVKLFEKLLKPENVSEFVPDVLKGVMWTEDNIAPESLINFSSGAWRPETDVNRSVGVVNTLDDWTNNPTGVGWLFSRVRNSANIQVSPSGKWIVLGVFTDPSSAGTISYIWIYVVQEGDVFRGRDGKVLDYVKPGDLCRLTWDSSDPYSCDNENLTYMYFPRKVASLDQDGKIVRNQPHFDALLRRATAPQEKCCETCCYTCSFSMNAQERFDYQVATVSDKQQFNQSPPPPAVELIDRL